LFKGNGLKKFDQWTVQIGMAHFDAASRTVRSFGDNSYSGQETNSLVTPTRKVEAEDILCSKAALMQIHPCDKPRINPGWQLEDWFEDDL
jgi:hypothetical protein